MNSFIHTCSTCINDSYLDSWAIPWAEDGKKVSTEIKSRFILNDIKISEIQDWTNDKFEKKEIGWINTFSNLETLLNYKSNFFPNENDFEIFSINFPEQERIEFLQAFNKESTQGEIGLTINLKKSELEKETELEIGFDLIGVEDGGDFHTFHCHDLSEDLIQKFNVEINEFGLIKNSDNWKEIIEYMNDEVNGFEPVPWFFVKVKKVNVSASS